MSKRLTKFGIATAFWFAGHVAIAGTLSGIVKDNDGKTLEGVMIRLTDPVSGMSESVFSNASGGFALTTTLQGQLTLRLRIPYHRDVKMTVNLADTAKLYRDVSMEVMTDATEISSFYSSP